MEEILINNVDYINKDVQGQCFAVTYEEEIIFYNGKIIKYIYPRQNYTFNNAKFLKKSGKTVMVILSNNKKDNNKSIITITDI